MTTDEQQVATNAAAVRSLAARLERMGYSGGDAHTEAEQIAANLYADGYRPLPRPVPVRGPGASRAAIDAAVTAAAEAVRKSKVEGGRL